MIRALKCSLALCLIVCVSAARADRLETSPRHHEWVDIEAEGDRKLRAWVVYPEVDGPATAVVVIHENRGLTDWERRVADQLAEAGFVAITPDMLSQTAPGGGNTADYESSDAARDGIYRLPAEQVMTDLDAVVEYAKKLPAANGVVAVGGFCWGGGQTFNYAAHNPNIAAACVFYGSGPRDDATYEKIEAPVYGFYGGNDFRINAQIPEIEERMNELDKEYDPVIYEGAGHGFLRQAESATDPDDANRRAADQAWERWTTILAGLEAEE